MLKVLNVCKGLKAHNVKYRWFSHAFVNKQNETTATVEPTVLVEKDSNITLIGINRESKRNAIDTDTAAAICEALHSFESDVTSPVAVLYGVGGSFCSGHDLSELEQQAERGSVDFLLQHEGSVGPTRRNIKKTVICGISGFCVASGLELALMCDLRVMEESAVLGFFNRHLGVPLIDGGTARLPALIGYSRAFDLIATGRRVNGTEALQLGLVNRLVATGTALGQAVNLAFSIAKYPQASMQHDRDALYASAYEQKGFRHSIQNEIMFTTTEVLQEMHEGARRFNDSALKGAKADSWNIKEKSIPDWEKVEIAHEERHNKVKNNESKSNI